MTHVEAVFEFAQVLPQVLARNVDMRSANAVLDSRPEAFKGVCMMLAKHTLFGRMVDGSMLVAMAGQGRIGLQIVGAECELPASYAARR